MKDMQPLQSSLRNIATPAASSKPPAISAKAHREQPSSSFPTPAAKRLKTSHPPGNFGSSANMNKGKGVMEKTNTMLVDLTRPQPFQPKSGAKKLIIKNLRPAEASQKASEEYYRKTWNDLDSALKAILAGQPLATPLEVLCRGVEALCRQHRSEELAKKVKQRCKEHLETKILPQIEHEAGEFREDNVATLQIVYKYWKSWTEQSKSIRSIFSYLDRSYLLTRKDTLTLEDQGIDQFRKIILLRAGKNDGRSMAPQVVSGVCKLVEYDRSVESRSNGSDLFNPELLRNSLSMLNISRTYGTAFEPEFLKQSEVFFEEFARGRSSSELSSYIAACDRLLARETLRCDTYNFDSATKGSLLTCAHYCLIQQCTRTLLSTSGISKLINENAIDSLKGLYGLLCLSKIQSSLKMPWEDYIKVAGSAIVCDQERVPEMIVRLLELKRKLDLIIRDAFSKDEMFTFSLRESFSNFINDKKNTTTLGNSLVGEMIAKYLDLLLRNGLKAVPRSLEFDAKDRDAAEKAGQASTGDEDAELDRQLEQGLELFRFIEGKDVFEAFYKKDLARRLLMNRSASQDAEKAMLAKLKAECGSSFTHNLEQMFKDQELARDEMVGYKQSLPNTSKTTLDLQVNVLCSAAWPTYPDVAVNLPPEVARHIEKYDRHYKMKHSGRKLTWKHALSHSIVKAHFDRGTKELLVSGFQAIVLVLFNDIGPGGNLSYTDIASATGLIEVELKRTLQSLACAKVRPLTKVPKSREINDTDTFIVNTGFSDPKIRIKINQIQLKETKEENKETHDRVYQDRQYETQAAIVRIMKSRKTMSHQVLISEVIDQTKKRGQVEIGEIKKNIEKLIEKEYIEREGDSYVYLA